MRRCNWNCEGIHFVFFFGIPFRWFSSSVFSLLFFNYVYVGFFHISPPHTLPRICSTLYEFDVDTIRTSCSSNPIARSFFFCSPSVFLLASLRLNCWTSNFGFYSLYIKSAVHFFNQLKIFSNVLVWASSPFDLTNYFFLYSSSSFSLMSIVRKCYNKYSRVFKWYFRWVLVAWFLFD